MVAQHSDRQSPSDLPPTMTVKSNNTRRRLLPEEPSRSKCINNNNNQPSILASQTKPRACRVCFFVNGDRHFQGLHHVINLNRVRTLDALCAELTRLLVSLNTLPSGVRFIFDCTDGNRVDSVHKLRPNGHYVCASTDHLIRLDYLGLRPERPYSATLPIGDRRNMDSKLASAGVRVHNKVGTPRVKMLHSSTGTSSSNCSSLTLPNGCGNTAGSMFELPSLKPKIVALLRGACRSSPSYRPSRRAFRFLLNHRVALSYEQLLNEISRCVKLNVGAVHKMYSLSTGKQITSLSDLSDGECVYLVYGRSEKCSSFDFMLDDYEQHDIISIVGPGYKLPEIEENNNNSKAKNRKAHYTSERINDTQDKQLRTPNESVARRKQTRNERDLKALSLPHNFCTSDSNTSLDELTTEDEKENEVYLNFCSSNQSRGKFASKLPPSRSRFAQPSSQARSQWNQCQRSMASSEYYLPQSENSSSYSTGSGLVFDYASSYGTRSDDQSSTSGGGHVLHSGSTTPGAASSVSCSEDFSFAPIKPPHPSSVVSPHLSSYYDEDEDEVDESKDDDDHLSSHSHSTPHSISSLSRAAPSSGFVVSQDEEDPDATPRHRPIEPAKISAEWLELGKPAFEPKKEVAEQYYVDKLIGDGKFGVVYTCIHRASGTCYALKLVDKLAMQQMLSENDPDPSGASTEAAILKRLQHPNIVRLYDHFDYPDVSYLILEYLKGGDLFDAITVAVSYSEPDAISMIRDLVQALDYLHRNNIVHRDIKLENLMVAFVPISEGSQQPTTIDGDIVPQRYRQMIKLADFGLAVEINPKELLFTVCGTPTYVAPEILLEVGYSFGVDIWAAGVIAYILLCGFPPFANEENNQEALFEQIIGGYFDFSAPKWQEVSIEAKQLIERMLCVDQRHRLTAFEVLHHDWLLNTSQL